MFDHLQANLGEDHALEDLARIACFSPWHFHRVFTAVTGETLPAYRITYLRQIGPYEHEGIGRVWEELGRWAGHRGLMGPHNPSFGVSHDNPEVTPAEKCRYDAGVMIPEGPL